jgi:hypothetical protein
MCFAVEHGISIPRTFGQPIVVQRLRGILSVSVVLWISQISVFCLGRHKSCNIHQTKGLTVEIFVGNLPPQMNSDQLQDFFRLYGDVSAARVIVDKFSGLSRGFGFVKMPNDDEAIAVIKAANGQELQGCKLKVQKSQTPPRRQVD